MKTKRIAAMFIFFLMTFLHVAPAWSQKDESISIKRTASGPSQIVLDRSVFFTDENGKIAEIPAGTYEVSKAGANVIAIKGAAVLVRINASAYRHDESIESDLARSIGKGKNVHHIVWLDADGAGLVAVGSYTGTSTRAATRFNAAALRPPLKTFRIPPKTNSVPIAVSSTADTPEAQIYTPPPPCSDVMLDMFHAVAHGNHPNNVAMLHTYAGIFGDFGSRVDSDLIVKIPDAVLGWRSVQFTFKTKFSETAKWRESLSTLRPYSAALGLLTAAQATSLGYMNSPGRTCFIKAWLTNPRHNKSYSIGASSYDEDFADVELTFIDGGKMSQAFSNESIRWSGGSNSSAVVGFGFNRPTAYNIEYWYFNLEGVFTRQSAFQLRIENCGRPPQERPSGSYSLTCNG